MRDRSDVDFEDVDFLRGFNFLGVNVARINKNELPANCWILFTD